MNEPVTAAMQPMAWWGQCDQCHVKVIVAANADMEPGDRGIVAAGREGYWEGGQYCPVCDGTMSWNGSDPTAEVLR